VSFPIFVHRFRCCLNHFVGLHGFRIEVQLAKCGFLEITLVPFRRCLIVLELDLFFFYLVLPHELKEDLIAWRVEYSGLGGVPMLVKDIFEDVLVAWEVLTNLKLICRWAKFDHKISWQSL